MPLFTRHLLHQPAITADLSCASCGYNLRGLTRAGRCPECGIEILESLNPDRTLPFQTRFPLAVGFTLLAAGLALIFVVTAACPFLDVGSMRHFALIVAGYVAAHALWALGAWTITLPVTRQSLWGWQNEAAQLRVYSVLGLAGVCIIVAAFLMPATGLEMLGLLQVPLMLLWWILQSLIVESVIIEIGWRLRIKLNFAAFVARRVRFLLVLQLLFLLPPLLCCLGFMMQSPVGALAFVAPGLLVALSLPLQSFLLLRLAWRIRTHRLPGLPP